ncbi:Hypothetical protein PYTT_0539 [Akkermansia glycaniphila]|uniref:Uncharacterized protein n=1 Tax=Akkermansia glycaniphila TaxID=1679444 RepID=A0A1H6KLS7_9BACT|nr:Hypothetical protein PYTT_0539 [Akkermansia glycaniphila]
MGFMDYAWTLRSEITELGKDTSRIISSSPRKQPW